jgi:hypothetical protein
VSLTRSPLLDDAGFPVALDRYDVGAQYRGLHPAEAALRIEVLLAGLGVEDDAAVDA